MKVNVESNLDDFMSQMQEDIAALNQSTIEALEYAANKVVADARQVDTYKDRTGNLRHSLGYAIIDNHAIAKSSIPPTPGSNSQAVVGQETTHMAMGAVIVAGMPYASYVEARGYDVLTGSALKFEDYLKEAME